MKKVIITSSLLLSVLFMASAQVKLSFNPEPGAKYEYHTEVVQNIKQIANGRELPREEKVTMTCLMSIKSKNAEGIEVLLTYQDISYVMTSPMGIWGYDSKKPFENPMNRDGANERLKELEKMHGHIFGSAIDKTITVVIAPDGSVNSVTGMEAITESITQAVANDGEMGASLSSTMIKQFFSENAIEELIEQSWKNYPVTEVKSGDKWNIENRWGGVSTMVTSTKSQCALEDLDNNTANIAIEAAVEVDMTGGKLTGNQSGKFQVNLKTGVPVSSYWTRNVKGNVVSMGMDMVMEVTHETKTSTREVK